MRLFLIRFLLIFLILFFLFPTSGQSVETIHTSAQNAILIEETSGRVLYEKNAHEQRPIASITKVMTAIVALEYGLLTDNVLVSERAIQMSGSSIYLEKDEEISLEDLLYGLMLRSGNDAAVAIAEHIGGSVEGFVYLMNEKARYLGMTNTSFINPHGLDEKKHYSSAYDMAILMNYAMKNEMFKKISRTKSYQAKNRVYAWNNKNKLLTNLYTNSTGGKTGYTNNARRTLVSTAKKSNLPLIVVTLNAPDDWNDHIQLFEFGFEKFFLTKLESKGERTFTKEDSLITGFIQEDVVYPLAKEEETKLTKHVILQKETKKNIIGNIIYSIGKEPVIEVPIFYVEMKDSSIFTEFEQSLMKIMQVHIDG